MYHHGIVTWIPLKFLWKRVSFHQQVDLFDDITELQVNFHLLSLCHIDTVQLHKYTRDFQCLVFILHLNICKCWDGHIYNQGMKLAHFKNTLKEIYIKNRLAKMNEKHSKTELRQEELTLLDLSEYNRN